MRLSARNKGKLWSTGEFLGSPEKLFCAYFPPMPGKPKRVRCASNSAFKDLGFRVYSPEGTPVVSFLDLLGLGVEGLHHASCRKRCQ